MNSSGDTAVASNFSFPEDWNDDQRMNVMFAPFRDKTTYLKSWEQKMKFWTALITERCKVCDELIVDLKTLSHAFLRKGKVPSGLHVVISEMARQGKLKAISDYDSHPAGWISWGYTTFVKTPFVWGVNKLLQRSENVDVSGQFVLIEAVKAKGRELLQSHQTSVECSLLENVIDITTLKKKYGMMFKSDQDFNLVLKQLESDKKVIIFRSETNDTVVKFAEKDESVVSPVRDIETKVFRIQQTSELLEREAEVLSASIEKYTEDARQYLKKGLKSTALSCLRKKKKTQTLLDKKLNTLDTFHSLIETIKNTVSEKMVIEAYEVATASLKNYRKTNKLTVDRVDDVMDNLQEVTQDQEEIAATIGNFNPSSWETTQDDLEEELDNILAEGGFVAKGPELSPPKKAQVSPAEPFYTNSNSPLPSNQVEMEEDYQDLEERLRQLYNPNPSPKLPELPLSDLSPISSSRSPTKQARVPVQREEEPMVIS